VAEFFKFEGESWEYSRGWYLIKLYIGNGIVVGYIDSANNSKPKVVKGHENIIRKKYGKFSVFWGNEVEIADGSEKNEVVIDIKAKKSNGIPAHAIIRTCVI